MLPYDSGGATSTRPLPREWGAEELHGDPTVGPHPMVWLRSDIILMVE